MAGAPLSTNTVLSILEKIDLRILYRNFEKQKITKLDTCKELSDTELSKIGLTTIGDRARFRAEVKASSTLPTTPTSHGMLSIIMYHFPLTWHKKY